MKLRIGNQDIEVDASVTPVVLFVDKERTMTVAKLIDAQGKEHPININANGKAQMT